MSDFPLIEKLGIKVWTSLRSIAIPYVHANELEAILENAPVVRAQIPKRETEIFWSKNPTPANDDTHTARLLLIENVKPKEDAESLLRDIVGELDTTRWDGMEKFHSSVNKAREYLKAKGV